MKTLRGLSGALALLAGLAGSALASPAPDSDHMGIGAWLFIGFCALIFVAQLVPALILLFGMVKGLFGRKEKTSSAPFG
jgi:hypothetical protein